MDFLNRHRIWTGVIAVIVIVAFVYSIFGRSSDEQMEIPLSEVIAEAQAGNVGEIEIRSSRLTVFMKDGRELRSRKERDSSLIDVLQNAGVQVGGDEGVVLTVKSGGWGGVIGIAITFLPLLLFGSILVFFMRRTSRRD